MSDTRKIFYWQDVIGDENILEEYREDISRVLAGEYKAYRIEKLANYNIYSMRVDKKGRLLFTTMVENDIPYLVLLEALPNHEYDASRFLKHGVLQRFLQKNIDKLQEQAASWSAVSDEDTEKLFSDKGKQEVEFVARRYYQHHFIQLSFEQEQAIKARFPLIISGCAGSGKTCVALSMLTQLLQTLEDTEGAGKVPG